MLHYQEQCGNMGCRVFRKIHTASFWDITIQWTSHDDLTEKLPILKAIKKILLQWFDRIYFACAFFFEEEMLSDQSGGQTHGLILFKIVL